jgi:glycosyltransferase involved in cell wall biosynthesis
MKILFPYLARWRSANRSRYHQLLGQLCRQGHRVFVLKAPPMALDDISATDLNNCNEELPPGLTLSELYAPAPLRSLWKTWIPRTKLLKKGLLSLTSIGQVRRFIEKEKIDALLVYNLPQVNLLRQSECRTHFDLADDLVAMLEGEHNILARAGAISAARLAQQRMLKQAETVTVASSVLADQIDREVLMLPNGADVTELDQADGSAWRARRLGPTVGFVGAFEYWVDFDLVMNLARRMPQVTFLLVGGGRRWKVIKQQVEQRGLTNVVLTGAVPYEEAMNYVAGMDVCLLPFTHDAVSDGSCPLKLFEYAALRKPIISTCTREVMRIGQGWIAFADDVTSFAYAIDSFLADPKAAERCGETGRALVEQVYNWPLLAQQFADLLMSGAVPRFEWAGAQQAVLEAINSRA